MQRNGRAPAGTRPFRISRAACRGGAAATCPKLCRRDTSPECANTSSAVAVGYASAKENDVFVARKGAWVESDIGDFVKGKYKPGRESHEGVKK